MNAYKIVVTTLIILLLVVLIYATRNMKNKAERIAASVVFGLYIAAIIGMWL